MIQLINKDTKIYCSFSKNAGNKGCEFFNLAFIKYNINAIYKSFSINNIETALNSAKYLNFSGCAIAMPFKKIAFDLVDEKDISVLNSKSVNTIIFDYKLNKLIGYNTDYYAAGVLLTPYRKTFDVLYILGDGGLAAAVKAKANDLNFSIKLITRNNWETIYSLKNCLVFNCTPLKIETDPSNIYIDCLIGTSSGDVFHYLQAKQQFLLYTNIIYEL